MFFLNFLGPKKISKLCTLALFLVGCNGNGEEQSGSNLPSRQLVASDGFAVVTPDTPSMVNVAPHISGASVGDILTSVELIDDDPNCNGFSTTGHDLTFTVDTPSGVWCDYQYTATPSLGTQLVTAKMSVFASTSPVAAVKSLSHTMTRSGTSSKKNVTFDLSNLLGSDFPSGYELAKTGAKKPKVQSGPFTKGIITTSGDNIIYKEPDASGWNRIIYTLEDTSASASGGDKVGVIYITISEPLNTPPEIKKPEYNFNTENPGVIVKIHEEFPIDLSRFITEPDGQDWQLINVQAFSGHGRAEPNDPLSTTNKIIKYTPYLVGKQSITYTVADHYGGYSTGLIVVTAETNEKTETWTDLKVQDKLFKKPKRYSDGLAGGYAVSAVWESSLDNTIAAYSSDTAELYCRSLGYISTKTSMDVLRNEHYTTQANAGPLNKWPALNKYLIRDTVTSSYKSYDLEKGVEAPYDAAIPHYVTCIENSSLILTLLQNEVVADGKDVKIGEIAKPVSMDVTLSRASGSLDEADVNMITRGRRTSLDILTSSTKAGTYRFNVTNDDDDTDTRVSQQIKYIGNVKTATLKKTVLRAVAVSNGMSTAEVIYHLRDANNNPLANYSLNITTTAKDLNGVSFTEPELKTLGGRTGTVTGLTDNNGNLIVKLKSNSVVSDLIVKAELKFDTSKSDNTFEPDFVSFAGNAIDIIRLGKNGMLFTSSPSKAFIDALGGISTNGTNTDSWPPGVFYKFDRTNAQALCAAYNKHRIGGYDTWSLPAIDDLNDLYTHYGEAGLYHKHRWPINSHSYWSTTSLKSLYGGAVFPGIKTNTEYVSCVLRAKVFAGPDVSKLAKSPNFTQAGIALHGGALSYRSSNARVAKVNASTGEVEIRGLGTASIIVTEAAGRGYTEQSDSYTLTVSTLAGNLIDIVPVKKDGKLKFFTSSPSKAFIDALGGIATSLEATDNRPAGVFYRFSFANANALCKAYNKHLVGGRNTWRLATIDELVLELYFQYSDMFTAKGWPVSSLYVSSTPAGTNGLNVQGVFLDDDDNHRFSRRKTVSKRDRYYVSCVSP